MNLLRGLFGSTNSIINKDLSYEMQALGAVFQIIGLWHPVLTVLRYSLYSLTVQARNQQWLAAL